MLNENPSLDELRQELIKVYHTGDIDNTQLNALKALISLKLAEKRLIYAEKRLEKAGIFANEMEQDNTII